MKGGTWAVLDKPGPDVSTMLLLTDGTVLCQQREGRDWWLLMPDAAGRYRSGSWQYLNTMNHARLYFASAMLSDGSVIVLGGEDSTDGADSDTRERYDPAHPELGGFALRHLPPPMSGSSSAQQC